MPSPFDRINATRLAYLAIANLDGQLASGTSNIVAASSSAEGMFGPWRVVTEDMDWEAQRPLDEWWMRLRPVFAQLSRRPGQE